MQSGENEKFKFFLPNFRPVHAVLLLFFFFFLWGFCCWMLLCVTVTVDTPLSPSPSLQLLWERRRPNLCLCANVAAFASKRAARVLISCTCALSLRLHACVCFAYFCVFSVVFSSSTAIPLSAVWPSLKHQLVSEGPLGEKEMTGRLHSFFYPHKDVPLLPVLSFFQEVFAVRVFFFFRSVSLSLSASW